MTAPTEAEVRASVRAQLARYPLDDALDNAIVPYLTGPLCWRHSDPDSADDPDDMHGVVEPAALWVDFGPGPLDQALDHAFARARKRATTAAETAIVEVLVEEAVRFGAEHPDAPPATPADLRRSNRVVARI